MNTWTQLVSNVGLLGLLAVIVMGVAEQVSPGVDFDAVVLSASMFGAEIDLTLRVAVVLFFAAVGHRIRGGDAPSTEKETTTDA